ncbi:apelin receptor A [Latimeria chalumnae]|uniref:Apelin receptor b n=1 Tax=Latimeria chalumnae TaxID=7897 RepID=H3BE77_LATCH|nr:PREDICTED: apelin receptor A-like [Latimeria chalumnae]|eukprot:XP_005990330.1 PREDICTED: apelin receptor A-like [Latimeria chalumnae]
MNMNENYCGEYCEDNFTDSCDYTDWAISYSLIPVLYMLVFIFGLSGNGVVLFTVWKTKLKRRSADIYIGNLALADLAFVITLPLWAVYTALGYHWPFGSALCKISSYLVLVNMYASIFCLTCLSFDRYLAIVHSLSSSRLRSRNTILLSLAITWILSGQLALPALILRTTIEKDNVTFCDVDFSGLAEPQNEHFWIVGLSMTTTFLGFFLPFLLMTIFYCFIGTTVTRHFQNLRKEDQKKKRLLKIIITLVVIFAICWLPFHVLKTIDAIAWLEIFPISCSFQRFILLAHPYATCLAYVNSCLNPFLYAFFDLRFRSQCLCFLRLKKAVHGQISSVSSTMSGQTQKSEIQSLATKV